MCLRQLCLTFQRCLPAVCREARFYRFMVARVFKQWHKTNSSVKQQSKPLIDEVKSIYLSVTVSWSSDRWQPHSGHQGSDQLVIVHIILHLGFHRDLL